MTNSKRIHVLLIMFFLFSAVLFHSCSDKLKTRTLQVGNITYKVEIARTMEERAKGLMYRNRLKPETGMLFVFPRDQKLSFWMKDTKVPLSIAFISKDGIIKEIIRMKPLSRKNMVSTYSVRYALEVNRGEFERLGIKVGDRVIIPEDL